jgi:hypothetical protein
LPLSHMSIITYCHYRICSSILPLPHISCHILPQSHLSIIITYCHYRICLLSHIATTAYVRYHIANIAYVFYVHYRILPLSHMSIIITYCHYRICSSSHIATIAYVYSSTTYCHYRICSSSLVATFAYAYDHIFVIIHYLYTTIYTKTEPSSKLCQNSTSPH